MSKYQLGIALAEGFLHCSLVSKEKNKWRILDSHTYHFNYDTFIQTLRQIRIRFKRKARRIVLGLPYHQVLMKEIYVDSSLKDEEIYLYLQTQAATLFAKPSSHWMIDYEACPFSPPTSQTKPIRTSAVSKETVVQLKKNFTLSHLWLDAIEVDVLALSRLIPYLQFYHSSQAQGLLWIKSTEMIFLAAREGNFIYGKRSPFLNENNFHDAINHLIQFYNGLYPQHNLTHILLINENSFIKEVSTSHPLLKTAALNPEIWNVPEPIQANALCSLGLGIYEY